MYCSRVATVLPLEAQFISFVTVGQNVERKSGLRSGQWSLMFGLAVVEDAHSAASSQHAYALSATSTYISLDRLMLRKRSTITASNMS